MSSARVAGHAMVCCDMRPLWPHRSNRRDNQEHHMTPAKTTKIELAKMIGSGCKYIVVQRHTIDGIPAGTIISKHRTHDAACKMVGTQKHYYAREVQELDAALSAAFE